VLDEGTPMANRTCTLCPYGMTSTGPNATLCVCASGYEPSGSNVCEDIDECADETDTCPSDCTNTDGAYECTCPGGTLNVGTGCEMIVQHDVGYHSTCARSESGHIQCWGRHFGVELESGLREDTWVPRAFSAASGWDFLAVGGTACALSDGQLWCWDPYNDANDQDAERIGAADDWQTIAVGNHYCGIRGGALYCWGYDQMGELGLGLPAQTWQYTPAQVGGATDWQHISPGTFRTCGIRSGALYCWGNNMNAQIGDGTHDSPNTPVRVGSEADWAAVELGLFHSCGLRGDGALYCWGNNTFAQVGTGSDFEDIETPTQVGSATDWREIGAGYRYSCGIREGGALYCWGTNEFGQAAAYSDETIRLDVPTQLGAQSGWSELQAGEYHVCAKRDGLLYCWGSNAYGQLGDDGTDGQRNVPMPVGTELGWDSVSASQAHTCGIRGGALYCWGDDLQDQLGLPDSSTGMIRTPTRVGTDSDWDVVSAGYSFTCGIRDGALYCWGYRHLGSTVEDHTLTRVGSDADWQWITTGFNHACGLRSGALYCWGGYNEYGQIGDGTTEPRLTPHRIGAHADWTFVHSGGLHTCGIREGELYCWGNNGQGQIGDGERDDHTVPYRVGGLSDWNSVSTGWDQTCGIRNGGELWCWGTNGNGQLGHGGSMFVTDLPARVGTANDWTNVTTGSHFTCGTRGAALYCWGVGSSGQLADGLATQHVLPTLVSSSDWQSVDAGAAHVCGVRDWALYCWGRNGDGQLGLPYATPQLAPATR
jgi:alpha-tubulin suppressor-like RCC1 family protein